MHCEICNQDFENLGQHLKSHKIDLKEYYKQYIGKFKDDPVCPTCGKILKFSSLTNGFQKYCSMKCRNSNPDWKKKHDELVLKKFGSLRNTDDDKIRQTKNAKTKNKLSFLVKAFGEVLDYKTADVTYKCNVCKDERHYSYNYFSHRIKYQMNPCNVCQKTLLNFKQSSRQEEELFDFIKKNSDYAPERHNRKILDGQELDIYLPELNIAFEYDGTFWHMDKRFYNENDINSVKKMTAAEIWEADKNKEVLCNEKSVKLYRIAEFDWMNDKENIKKQILTLIRRNHG